MSKYNNEIVSTIDLSKSRTLHFVLSISEASQVLSHIRFFESRGNFQGYSFKNGFCFSIDHLNNLHMIIQGISNVDNPQEYGQLKYYSRSNEQIKILSNEWQNRSGDKYINLHIRKYYQKPDDSEWKPTSIGLSFNIKYLNDFNNSLSKLIDIFNQKIKTHDLHVIKNVALSKNINIGRSKNERDKS